MVVKKSYYIFGILVFTSILFFSSCKKEKQLFYTIEGKVFDPNYNTLVSDAEVKIYAKEISGGTINGNYVLKKSAKSGSDGKFLLEFERKSVVDYKVTISKSKFFSFESIIKQENLNVDEINTYNVDLFPKSIIKISVKNTNPNDEDDYVEVYFNQSTSYGCSSCIGKQRLSFSGKSVDTTIVGQDWANKELLMQYLVQKNGIHSYYDRSIFTSINDTTFIDIMY